MRIRQKSFDQIQKNLSWHDILRNARQEAEQMQFEASINTCLNYLHKYIPHPTHSPSEKLVNSIKTNIFLACGGTTSRWMNFMNVSKQMVDTGDGTPLIQRTINQFSPYFQNADLYLIANQHDSSFSSIQGAEIIRKRSSADRPAAIEALEYSREALSEESNILLIYGDVYFSDQAVEKIAEYIRHNNSTFTLFGRKQMNPQYGNNGGEKFAAYFPRDSLYTLLEYYKLLKNLYLGTPVHKYGTWELISLISALKKDSSCKLPDPTLINGKASITYQELANTRSSKEFHQLHWLEIDDETEDFDFPCEYIERIFRTVAWVGKTLDQSSSNNREG